MTITNFNSSNLKALRNDLDAAVAAVLAKHNVSGEFGGIRFTGTECKVKLTMKTLENSVNSNSVTIPKSDADRVNNHAKFECNANTDVAGKEVYISGKKMTIVGYNTRAKRYPYNVADSTGTKFKVSSTMMANALRTAGMA